MSKQVTVIGAGLVGCVAALRFAKEGWKVVVYEGRGDIRKEGQADGKSLNLAVSHRGIHSLAAISADLALEVLRNVVPIYGRMVHDTKGGQHSQLYDVKGKHINAIDRGWLNELLLNEIDKTGTINVYFNHKLLSADLNRQTLTFETLDKTTITEDSGFVVGADGAYSTVRKELMRTVNMDYSQEYIDTLWCEMKIPPDASGGYRMDQNHLHLWPRSKFMLMALPNQDGSFTGTLFMPHDLYDGIVYEQDLLLFFQKYFPDAIDIIGKDSLIEQFFRHPKMSLITVKCSPYHYRDRCVIVGDAAHAMVPFYGQGMNAGFEDIEDLMETIKGSSMDLEEGLCKYSASRTKSAHAICDLAMQNYVEMRDKVNKPSYLFRKAVEEFLYKHFPSLGVRTLYNMVSFTSIPYDEAWERSRRQGAIFKLTALSLLTGTLGLTAFALLKFRPTLRRLLDL